jgi:hypothetical protein
MKHTVKMLQWVSFIGGVGMIVFATMIYRPPVPYAYFPNGGASLVITPLDAALRVVEIGITGVLLLVIWLWLIYPNAITWFAANRNDLRRKK